MLHAIYAACNVADRIQANGISLTDAFGANSAAACRAACAAACQFAQPLNVARYRDAVAMLHAPAGTAEPRSRRGAIAVGLFSLGALLNHSCMPNCCVDSCRRQMRFS